MAECHPDRPHKGLGLCHGCYEEQRYWKDPEKYKNKTALWRERNLDRVKEYAIKYHSENIEKEKQRYRKYDIENREKRNEYARKRRPMILEYQRNWARENPDKTRAKRYRRQSRLNNETNSVSEGDIRIRIFMFGEQCAYCGGKYKHIDHLIPVSRGGRNIFGNIVPACDKCNCSKGIKEWHTWYRSRKFHNRSREKFIEDNCCND